MKRILAVIVIGLLALTGCTDTTQWTKIEASYIAGSTQQQTGDNYRLVITPTSATLSQGNNSTTREIDKGLWDTVRNSISAMSPRTSAQGCPGGQAIEIKGFTDAGEAYRFQSDSCEADSKVAEAKRILDLVVKLFQ